MTKELAFDLEFADHDIVHPVSPKGCEFLKTSALISARQVYQTAIDQGLHVRFANASLRDTIAAV